MTRRGPKPRKVVSPFVLQRIYREARRAVITPGSGAGMHSDPVTHSQVIANQASLRRVSVEFHKRLKKAGIYVEGA